MQKQIPNKNGMIQVWVNATDELTPETNPEAGGWKLTGSDYKPETTDDPIAPNAVIEMVSCSCKGQFLK